MGKIFRYFYYLFLKKISINFYFLFFIFYFLFFIFYFLFFIFYFLFFIFYFLFFIFYFLFFIFYFLFFIFYFLFFLISLSHRNNALESTKPIPRYTFIYLRQKIIDIQVKNILYFYL